jgi:hypothetical protein
LSYYEVEFRLYSASAMAAIGDILYLHDHDTKVSQKDRLRWCMVIGASGSMVQVTPRSTTSRGPVFCPAEAMGEFDKDGWFKRWRRPVPVAVANAATNIGQLREPERSQVLALFARRRS